LNEITLSNNLNVITAEINSYKQIAGQSIFEIGKRLKHVKENDLVHGQWQKYCEETLDISRVYANRYITVYEEFKNSNVNTSFGLNKLFQIATLPQEEREKEHNLSSGKTKTVDEMTSRELEEVKRQLKAERKERERLEAENEELSNQEPERIEVVPDDYDYIKGNFESAINLRNRYKEQLEEMRKELNESSNDVHLDDSEYESLKLKEENLRRKINSYEKLYDMQSDLELILKTMQPKIHSLRTDDIRNEYGIIDEFDSTLNEVIKVCKELKNRLPDKNIIEGEIVND